jgi:GNAT superfamily N-acetyltransferase
VVLRTVRSSDKELLREGFQRLSPQSRYLRFHGVKTELSDGELRYLTEVDGVRHFALGAIQVGPDGEHGVGVARLVQLPAEPGVADAAITVIDELQGKGLGTLLFQRLVAAAAERGIERVRAAVLGSNQAMQELVHKLAGDARSTIESGVITVEIGLPQVRADAPAEEAPRDSGLYQLLRLAARRVLSYAGLAEPPEE